MKKRTILINLILPGIFALILHTIIHEMGHIITAIITGNKIQSFSFGSESFAGINVVNFWSIPLISIGSFFLPVIVFIILSLFKKHFIKMLGIYIGFIAVIQAIINSVAILLLDKVSAEYNTYDLGILVNYTNCNPVIVSIISIVLSLIFVAILMYKLAKLINEL